MCSLLCPLYTFSPTPSPSHFHTSSRKLPSIMCLSEQHPKMSAQYTAPPQVSCVKTTEWDYSPGNFLESNLDWSTAEMVWWFLVATREDRYKYHVKSNTTIKTFQTINQDIHTRIYTYHDCEVTVKEQAYNFYINICQPTGTHICLVIIRQLYIIFHRDNIFVLQATIKRGRVNKIFL